MSFWIACSRLLTVDNTLMMQNIPIVTPNSERNVRSLFERNSATAILKLLNMMEKNFICWWPFISPEQDASSAGLQVPECSKYRPAVCSWQNLSGLAQQQI